MQNKVHKGKVLSYDWMYNVGRIKMDNGDIISFDENNCVGYINFNYQVNVSFKIKENEACNIKMIKQDILYGYIINIDRIRGIGFIKDMTDGQSKDISYKFNKKSCKDFNKLIVGDCVTYSWHYGKKKSKIVNVNLDESGNKIKSGVTGIITGIHYYRQAKPEFISITVYVGELKCNVCVQLYDAVTKFAKDSHVTLDIFEDAFRFDSDGNNMLYGKHLRRQNKYNIKEEQTGTNKGTNKGTSKGTNNGTSTDGFKGACNDACKGTSEGKKRRKRKRKRVNKTQNNVASNSIKKSVIQ